MKSYNITAQVYRNNDPDKQTILMNEIVESPSSNVAITRFYDIVDNIYSVVKIYSIEEI